jgi:hypothetical protein
MRSYVEEENKWLALQGDFMNDWEFKTFEPWYIKQAAEYQYKMYEGYRDDAKYMIETVDNKDATEDLENKSAEAKQRRDKYERLYSEFFEEASNIRDFRGYFVGLPLPEVCNEENTTIPNTSGSIDWDRNPEAPTPTAIPSSSDISA